MLIHGIKFTYRIIHQRLETSYHAGMKVAVGRLDVYRPQDLQESIQPVELDEPEDKTVGLGPQGSL